MSTSSPGSGANRNRAPAGDPRAQAANQPNQSAEPGVQDRRSRKRSAHGANSSHERWLLPYADMITLLLALFILLYSISAINNAKLEEAADSIQKAFNGSKKTPGQNNSHRQSQVPKESVADKLLNSGVSVAQLQEAAKMAIERRKDLDQLRRIQRRIEKKAKERGAQTKLTTLIDERGLVIRLISDKVLFDIGKARIRAGIVPLLTDITHILRTEKRNVRVEGHTDSVPINTALFSSNWELSAVRATSVVRLMISKGEPSIRLSAVGYASLKPIRSNKTSGGRQRNRRVEIVVLRNTGKPSH